jgi:hypothetical protein
MAYSSTGNPPFQMTAPPIAGGFTVGSSDMRGGLWFYGSSDAVATVRGTGYFTDGFNRGMRRGDIVFVFDTNTPNMSVNWVSSVATTGVTVSSATT